MSKHPTLQAIDDCLLDSDDSILGEARDALDSTIKVAIALLTLPDGKEVVAHYAPEFGDGEGYRQIRSFVKEVRQGKLLRDGESIKVQVRSSDFASMKCGR